jgi:hypothetical protein
MRCAHPKLALRRQCDARLPATACDLKTWPRARAYVSVGLLCTDANEDRIAQVKLHSKPGSTGAHMDMETSSNIDESSGSELTSRAHRTIPVFKPDEEAVHLLIQTSEEGYNSGRLYVLMLPSKRYSLSRAPQWCQWCQWGWAACADSARGPAKDMATPIAFGMTHVACSLPAWTRNTGWIASRSTPRWPSSVTAENACCASTVIARWLWHVLA